MDLAWLMVAILVPVVSAAGAIALIVFAVRRQFSRHDRGGHERGR